MTMTTTTRPIPTMRPEMKSCMSRGKPSGTHSPWGKADMQRRFAPGFIQVGTPRHGGFGVTMTFAEKLPLTHEARRRAIFQNGYFWFEEDCLYAILFWELGRDWWPMLFETFEPDPNGGTFLGADGQRRGIRRALRETITAWNADYLIAREETPDAAMFKVWTDRQREDQMRRDRSPDLITSAMYKDGEAVEKYGEPVTLVYTADYKHHVVRRSSYVVRTPNLLSSCDVLDYNVDIDFY